MSIPSTTITLYQTPFDASQTSILYFSSKESVASVMAGFPAITVTGTTYQRDMQKIRMPLSADTAEMYNYLSYINNGIITYAFLTHAEYVGDNNCVIEFTIDPVTTYAGQYTINPSPMVRQHPITDNWGENYFSEPVFPKKWEVDRDSIGFGDASQYVYIVTTVKSDTYSGNVESYWEALGKFAQGDSYTDLSIFMSSMQAVTCQCGGITQANTSVVTVSEAQEILQNFAQVGRQQDIIACYRVPDFIRNGTSGKNIASLSNYTSVLDLAIEYSSNTRWNKIKYSPEYNQLNATLYGNTRNYPYNLFTNSMDKVTFYLFANQSMNGNIVLSAPSNFAGDTSAYTYGEFSLQSPQWDTVAISGVAVNKVKEYNIQQSVLDNYVSTATNVIGNITDALSPLSLMLNPTGAIGDVANIAQNIYSGARQNANLEMAKSENIKNAGVVAGVNCTNMAAYTMHSPALSLAHYRPSEYDVNVISNYFSTFGYSYGNTIQTVNLNNMPIWNYVHTADAQIVGREIPQRYLQQIKRIFDSGVFIFKSISNYKNFGLVESNVLGG